MIDRQIKYETEKALKTFDWFNDYKDTRNWAKYVCPEVIDKLDEGYKQYVERTFKS